MIDRRKFLAGSLSALGAGAGFATNLASLNAFAQAAPDYKALVCVFLYGGLDGHDTILPYDVPSNTQYEAIRAPLLSMYDSFSPRTRNNLIKIGAISDGREFAMPRELTELSELYSRGKLAVVGNLGPLIEPINRIQFRDRSALRPKQLFSHNSQQSTWMTSQTTGSNPGWGGKFGDILAAAGENVDASFTTVSLDRDAAFLRGMSSTPFIMTKDGPRTVNALNLPNLGSADFGDIYERVLRDSAVRRANVFENDFVDVMKSSLDSNETMNSLLEAPGDPITVFPSTKLGSELQMISKVLARRNQIGAKRQIFFVPVDGFDTHSQQPEKLARRQNELSVALSAFYSSLEELGLENQVTTVTGSDFGRALGVNGDGTDHGWGGHHFVLGGAVKGGQILGDIPVSEFGHDLDSGRGRLIPQLSVDQYASALGRWFGLSDSDLDEVMPGLSNFDRGALSSLFL